MYKAYLTLCIIGLAHGLANEDGTLVKLNETEDDNVKLTYEWGHVVYFPNILLHAVYDHIRGCGNSLAQKKH